MKTGNHWGHFGPHEGDDGGARFGHGGRPHFGPPQMGRGFGGPGQSGEPEGGPGFEGPRGPFGRFGGRFGGRHGGHGGPGGGFERMERGALRLVLLDALRDEPRHGYDLIKVLEQRTNGQYSPSPGVIYPTLQYLEDLGLVSANAEASRRVFQITEAGLAELETHGEWLQAFWARFNAGTNDGPVRYEVGFLRDEFESLGRTLWTGLREAIAAGDVNTLKRVRQAIQNCREEVRGIVSSATETTTVDEAPNEPKS